MSTSLEGNFNMSKFILTDSNNAAIIINKIERKPQTNNAINITASSNILNNTFNLLINEMTICNTDNPPLPNPTQTLKYNSGAFNLEFADNTITLEKLNNDRLPYISNSSIENNIITFLI